MKATNRLDILLNEPSRAKQETSIVTFSERDSHPSSILPPVIATTAPLPPRRDSSSMKNHRRRRPQLEQTTDKQKQYQPLLNSSTLDDLFRALTLECEQYLAAAASSYQNKTYDQIINVQPSSTIQAAMESNDDDYENLHPPVKPITANSSPLKTSIQVISPIKRHVVSITVSSKITAPKKASCSTTKSNPRQSSEEESVNQSSSSTSRKHRRRRTRKQYLSSTTPTTRSSSSSTERKEIIPDKKRSCSTDPHKNTLISSSQKSAIKRPRRRDISLQHHFTNSRRLQENNSSPLSVLLTSTKPNSDFLDHSHQRQSRRSRLESMNHKSSTLLDRLHQRFYRPSSTQNNTTKNNNSNILTHRIPSHPVY